ncbi:MAG TPA: hypothetical protein VKA46_04610 [Gemmataceae bacterium]|nr:hypothetical protein [Gemmataceae bacterium]
MELPYRFPNEADVIRQEADAFRRLSPTERLRVILDLIASGMTLLEHSPQREAGRRLRDAQEAEWQRLQKELFARHAR